MVTRIGKRAMLFLEHVHSRLQFGDALGKVQLSALDLFDAGDALFRLVADFK